MEKRAPYSLLDEEDVRSFNLTITERGMKSFREMGIYEKVLENSVPLDSRIVHEQSCVCNPKTIEQRYGKDKNDKLYSIPRKVLVHILYEHLKETTDAEVLFNHELVEVDKQKAKVKALNSSGENFELDYQLLIGADGAFSKVRNYLLLGEAINFKINYFSWFYKKFEIPPEDRHVMQMNPNSLHVFPKEGALVVAIPNKDKSFSSIYCTRVSDPSDIKSERAKIEFEKKFQAHFPHIYSLSETVRKSFNQSKISGLVDVDISQWTSEGNIVLVGDAAHAVFPFYGQGMNSALQDCRNLVDAMEKQDSLEKALSVYEERQKASTDALSELCTKHFYYLQKGCTSPLLESQKFINRILYKVSPSLWDSEYRMVAQTDLPYDQIVEILKKQKFLRRVFGIFIFDYFGSEHSSILTKNAKVIFEKNRLAI